MNGLGRKSYSPSTKVVKVSGSLNVDIVLYVTCITFVYSFHCLITHTYPHPIQSKRLSSLRCIWEMSGDPRWRLFDDIPGEFAGENMLLAQDEARAIDNVNVGEPEEMGGIFAQPPNQVDRLRSGRYRILSAVIGLLCYPFPMRYQN